MESVSKATALMKMYHVGIIMIFESLYFRMLHAKLSEVKMG